MTTTNISYSINRPMDSDLGSVTVGTSAPGAGDVEVRIAVNSADSPPLTKAEVYLALERFWHFLEQASPAGFLE